MVVKKRIGEMVFLGRECRLWSWKFGYEDGSSLFLFPPPLLFFRCLVLLRRNVAAAVDLCRTKFYFEMWNLLII